MVYKLWHQPADFSRHKITIHDAVAQGLPLRVDELRAGIDDPQGCLIAPYELKAECACKDCRFQAVCRFDAWSQPFRAIGNAAPVMPGEDGRAGED